MRVFLLNVQFGIYKPECISIVIYIYIYIYIFPSEVHIYINTHTHNSIWQTLKSMYLMLVAVVIVEEVYVRLTTRENFIVPLQRKV